MIVCAWDPSTGVGRTRRPLGCMLDGQSSRIRKLEASERLSPKRGKVPEE